MCAGLERYVDGGTAYQVLQLRRNGVDAIHFGMRLPVLLVVALPDNNPLVYQHRAHHGVGGYRAGAQAGQLNTALHICFVEGQNALNGGKNKLIELGLQV